MDNQQRPIVLHMELCSLLYASLDGSGVWGRTDTCIYVWLSPLAVHLTTTTLLISYTPKQNVSDVKKIFFSKNQVYFKNLTLDMMNEVRVYFMSLYQSQWP